MAENLGNLFVRHERARAAITELSPDGEEREITYERLSRRCDAVARGLAKRGLRAGDRIGILAGNRLEYFETLFGAMRAGCVVVPINIRLPPPHIDFVAQDAGLRLLFVDPGLVDASPTTIPHIVYGGADSPDSYEAFLDPGAFEAFEPSERDVALQLYTSGSTGRSKGVLLTHAGLCWLARMGAAARAESTEDRSLAAAPLYHMFGLLVATFVLGTGSRLFLMNRFEPRRYIEAIGRHRITMLTGIAAMYSMMLAERELLDRTDLSTVKSAAVGSSPYSAQLFAALTERFPNARVTNGYGITEGGGVFGAHPERLPRPPSSIGYPMPGVELKLVDGPNENEGVLWVRSPAVMLGYHNRPEETAKRLKDGWLDTGDVCRRDERGFYYFVRRADDMFKCGGENVFPRDVEQRLETHPDVVQAAVVPAPHDVKGQVPVAFVVLREGATTNEDAIKAWAIEHGPAYEHPRRVFVEAQLPVNGTFKVDIAALRARAARMRL